MTLRRYTDYDMLGIYYGFPICCMGSFCKNDNLARGETSHIRHPKLFLTGFLPCDDCFENKTDEQLLAEIAEHRKAEYPFPEGKRDSSKEYWQLDMEMFPVFLIRITQGLSPDDGEHQLKSIIQDIDEVKKNAFPHERDYLEGHKVQTKKILELWINHHSVQCLN